MNKKMYRVEIKDRENKDNLIVSTEPIRIKRPTPNKQTKIKPTLALVVEMIVAIQKTLKEHTVILNRHSELLEEHTAILNRHSELLEKHTAILNRHSELLEKHSAIFERNNLH
ncbi:MAG: hypothetical protein LBV37_00355 [Mycoplasmataceae bacterium]|jgi:hypothetical protein|nr:hypothetical protein [Mycoplasmataceae bacterium]